MPRDYASTGIRTLLNPATPPVSHVSPSSVKAVPTGATSQGGITGCLRTAGGLSTAIRSVAGLLRAVIEVPG